MDSNRIKEIQETTAYPESVSVKQALLQVWNECEQDKVKNTSTPSVLNQRDLLIDFCKSMQFHLIASEHYRVETAVDDYLKSIKNL